MIADNGRSSKSDAVQLELETFAEDATSNLKSLQSRLAHGTFQFVPAKGVPIPKLDSQGKKTNKFRPIVLAPVKSRIVQRAILNVLLTVENIQPYAQTPFSFGGIRGPEKRRDSEKVPRAERAAAVPAAIRAVLKQIEAGGRYVACADISRFFTRVSKPYVSEIVAKATEDPEFVRLFDTAIAVELANLAELREKSADFPIEEIGVAQGNSLSPLLGNIALADFDRQMNAGDCRCIRYIDDFIIVAPTEKAANARLRLAREILSRLKMDLSPEKTAKGGTHIKDGFEFLGINISPGVIRPSAGAQQRFLASLEEVFNSGSKAMRGYANGAVLDRSGSLIGTLKRADGMINGWGKHYWFCNDLPTMKNIDRQIGDKVREFLGEYRNIRLAAGEGRYTALLGLPELSLLGDEAFTYPKRII